MFKSGAILFLYTETPLHAGSGTSLGMADLPVQREKATNLPVVQPSGLKGVFRHFLCEEKGINGLSREIEGVKGQLDAEGLRPDDRAKLQDKLDWLRRERKNKLTETGIQAVFGPETDEASEHSGAVSFTDGRLVLFPVRSLYGMFAWITCPQVLNRLRRDLSLVLELSGHSWPVPWEEVPQVEQGKALVTRASTVCKERGVVLEEYTFTAEESEIADAVARWLVERALPDGDTYRYWRSKLFTEAGGEVKSNLVILSDADLRDFTLFATEILTRIRIDPATGTVAPGALWTEEHLPPDSLLYTVVLGADPHANAQGVGVDDAASVIGFVVGETDGKIIQMGGDATVGRGLVRVRAFKPGR